MESTLRLISANPVDRLARTVEALLVVASAPLSVEELCEATRDDPERIETAIGLLRERYSEGRSGIVLEAACRRVGLPGQSRRRRGVLPAVRASRRTRSFAGGAGDARDRRVSRTVHAPGRRQDSGSLGRLRRREPRRARPHRRGGARERPGGAVRYRTTPLFERVFGLQSLAALPRLDDLAEDTAGLRERLLEVAEARAS